MNLLYTSTSYPPALGGAQLLHHRTAIELAKRHSVQVVTQWDTNRSDWLLGTTVCAPARSSDYIMDGIPVHRIGLSLQEKLSLLPATVAYYPLMGLALPAISGQLESRLEPFAAEADLVHNVRIGREGLSQASYQIARARGIPFILTPVHHPRWTGWRYREYIRLYRQADALIALTNAERRILIGLGVPEERVHVTGFGPILADGTAAADFLARLEARGPIILFLGQHYDYKGYRQILEAAPVVWTRHPQAVFVFIGRAVGRSEEHFRASNDPRIVRLGEVGLQEKSNALAACTLLCVPSTQESFGGVYTEAWSYGKPVIGCNIPAVSEVITDGEDGVLVSQEAGPVADAINRLLACPSLASAMGEAGREKVRNRYSWERLAALTEEAYSHVTGSRPAS